MGDSGAIEAVLVNTNQVERSCLVDLMIKKLHFVFVGISTNAFSFRIYVFFLLQFYKWFTDLESAMKSEVSDSEVKNGGIYYLVCV